MRRLSVIVPCRNEERLLDLTLSRLVNELHSGFIHELILVDNQSNDGSVQVAYRHPEVQVLSCLGTISQVRNFGAAHSQGEFLCFVDADVEIVPGWGREIHALIESYGVNAHAVVFGNTYGIPERPTWIERVWFQSLHSRRKSGYINGGNLIVSRTAFEQIVGFDPERVTGEDVDFCRRAIDRGFSVFLEPSLRTIHHGYPKRLVDFYRRERWHAVGMLQDLRHPWKSRPLQAMLAVILLPLLLYMTIDLLDDWMPAAQAAALTIFVFYLLVAQRCERALSLDPPRLMLLFLVYTMARTLTLMTLLVTSGRYGAGFRSRRKAAVP